MKMMNDMELDRIAGGYLDVGGTVSEEEYDATMELLKGDFKNIGDKFVNAFDLLWYVYNK